MFFFFIVIFIAIISFVWALWSLKREKLRKDHVKKVREDLSKERIIFQDEGDNTLSDK